MPSTRITIYKKGVPYYFANKGSGFVRISKIEYETLTQRKVHQASKRKSSAKKPKKMSTKKAKEMSIKLKIDNEKFMEFMVHSVAEAIELINSNPKFQMHDFWSKLKVHKQKIHQFTSNPQFTLDSRIPHRITFSLVKLGKKSGETLMEHIKDMTI